jgi:hypothetical protein
VDSFISIEKLAAQQGVRPVVDIEDLPGHPSDEDESVEEFAVMLRSWRCTAMAVKSA